MTTNIGWCWTGTIPELLVIEPERLKTPKVENKQYNKRGVIDCPSYQSFYNNLFVLKSPVSFTAVPKEGGVDIESDELDTNQKDILLANSPEEFCAQIKNIYFDKRLWLGNRFYNTFILENWRWYCSFLQLYIQSICRFFGT